MAPVRMVGLDGQLVVPVAGWSDEAGLGLGVFLRYEHRQFERSWSVTGRLGWVYYLEKSAEALGVTVTSNVQTVPLLVGAKYFFLADAFVQGEAGIVLLHTFSQTSGVPGQGTIGNTGNHLKMMLSVGGGYELRVLGSGAIVVAVYLQTVNVGELADTLQLAFTAGYNFWSF